MRSFVLAVLVVFGFAGSTMATDQLFVQGHVLQQRVVNVQRVAVPVVQRQVVRQVAVPVVRRQVVRQVTAPVVQRQVVRQFSAPLIQVPAVQFQSFQSFSAGCGF